MRRDPPLIPNMPLVIYKLGGSLLTLPDLDRRLAEFFEQPVPLAAQFAKTSALHRAVLVGGGRSADLVRAWDRKHKLGAERAHDLALDSMGLNARLVSGLLPNARLVTKHREMRTVAARGAIAILDPGPTLQDVERKSTERLPRSWDVTSDSIAAFLAIHLKSDALVLVKSMPMPKQRCAKRAAQRGVIDRYFSRLCGRVPVIAWANLRGKNATIERWL